MEEIQGAKSGFHWIPWGNKDAALLKVSEQNSI